MADNIQRLETIAINLKRQCRLLLLDLRPAKYPVSRPDCWKLVSGQKHRSGATTNLVSRPVATPVCTQVYAQGVPPRIVYKQAFLCIDKKRRRRIRLHWLRAILYAASQRRCARCGRLKLSLSLSISAVDSVAGSPHNDGTTTAATTAARYAKMLMFE